MAAPRKVENGGTVMEKKETDGPKLAALLATSELGAIREVLGELDRLTKQFGGRKEQDYVLDDGEAQELLLDPNRSLKKVNSLLKHEPFTQALVQLLVNDVFLSQPQSLDRDDISTLLLLFRRLCKIPDFVARLITAGFVEALPAFCQRFRTWGQLMTPLELRRSNGREFLSQRLGWFQTTLALVWGLLNPSRAFAERAARSELFSVLVRVWPPPGFEHSKYFTNRIINFDIAQISLLLLCALESAAEQRLYFSSLFDEKRNEIVECFLHLMVWQRHPLAGSEDPDFPRWVERTWSAFGALKAWQGARRKLVKKVHRLGTELVSTQAVTPKIKALVKKVLRELETELSGAAPPRTTEIDLSRETFPVETFLPRPKEVTKGVTQPQLAPAELASLFKSQNEGAILRGVKELAVIQHSCVTLLKDFVVVNPLPNWEKYEAAGLHGILFELLEGPLGDWLAHSDRAEEALTILVFLNVLNRGWHEDSGDEDKQDEAMLRIVDWAVRRWRDLHPGVLWAALMLIGGYCAQSDACRLAAAQRGSLRLARDAVQLSKTYASETASDSALRSWVRDAEHKGWVLCDVILRTDPRTDEETAAKLREVAREVGLAEIAARGVVKGPQRAGLHVLSVLEASIRDESPGALADLWALKGLVRGLLELLRTAARLVDRPSDDGDSSSGEESDGGAPRSDARSSVMNGGAPQSDGQGLRSDGRGSLSDNGAPRSNGGASQSDSGGVRSDGGSAPSDGGALRSDGEASQSDGGAPQSNGVAARLSGPAPHTDSSIAQSDGPAFRPDGQHSDGPERLPSHKIRQLHPFETRDFWADETPLWARARAACAQALGVLSRAVEGGAFLEFVRLGGVETVAGFLRRSDVGDQRGLARLEAMRCDDSKVSWRLRASESWVEAGRTAEALWERAAAEAGLKKCPRVAECRQRESMKGVFQQCGRRCGTYYCSKKCQEIDWRAGHKKKCIPAAGSKSQATGA